MRLKDNVLILKICQERLASIDFGHYGEHDIKVSLNSRHLGEAPNSDPKKTMAKVMHFALLLKEHLSEFTYFHHLQKTPSKCK
ncbi:hypothetical protein T06_14202 [Trichinella sp. T6]|nr:hypothetical protein T06_14202 [Trichinella sp. T6]